MRTEFAATCGGGARSIDLYEAPNPRVALGGRLNGLAKDHFDDVPVHRVAHYFREMAPEKPTGAPTGQRGVSNAPSAPKPSPSRS